MKNSTETDRQSLVQVHVVEDHFEAEILLGALRLEGIECICRSHEEIAYNGLFVLQRGWGTILVREDQMQLARQIIEEALKVYGKGPHLREVDAPGNLSDAESKTGGEP